MNGIGKYVGYAILGLLIAFWIRAAYIIFYPFDPLTIHDVAIVDEDNTVFAGQNVVYEVHFIKRVDAYPEIQRELINHSSIRMAPVVGSNRIGEDVVRSEVQVPGFADSGMYKIRITYVYRLFSFPERKIEVSADTPPFKVVNPREVIDNAVLTQAGVNKKAIRENAENIMLLERSLMKTDRKANRMDTKKK